MTQAAVQPQALRGLDFRQNIARHLVASGFMAGGGFSVFLLVFVMNSDRPAPPKEEVRSQVEFQVDQTPKKKKKPKQKREKPKPRPRAKSAPAPRAPNLSSAISEASFGFSGVDVGDVMGVSKDVIGDFSKKGPMTADSVDVPPKPSRRVAASYPDQAVKRGLEGYVNFNVEVMADGRVGRMKILDSQPKGVFEEAARTAMSQWEFQPALYQDQPQTTWVKQRIAFKLNKG